MDWENRYEGEKKPSKQTRALRRKRATGVKFATPKETQRRVATILDLMQRGLWHKRASVEEHARMWGVSVKRVQQLVAEANRQNV